MTIAYNYDKVERHRTKSIYKEGKWMAKKVTCKKALYGNRRSHSLRATRHAQKPNLQKVTLDNGQSVRMSASELRTMNKISKNIAA